MFFGRPGAETCVLMWRGKLKNCTVLEWVKGEHVKVKKESGVFGICCYSILHVVFYFLVACHSSIVWII